MSNPSPKSRARGLRLSWRRPWTAPLAFPAAHLAVVVVALLGAGSGNGGQRPWDCVSAGDIPTLRSWSRVAGRQFKCAVAYIDAAPTWQTWEDPWIIQYRRNWPKFDWVDWYAGGRHGHRLILTLSLIPSGLRGTNWLPTGLAGAYRTYDRTIAKYLVHAGMGNTVIRLGHEANGTWYADSLADTPIGDAEWARFWAMTVRAMRSVPGAHFLFDWTVNAGVRPIPLQSFYPGDDVVNIIGVDAYDSIAPAPAGNRLRVILHEPDGLLAVEAFARSHHKPMSIPEWGIGPNGQGGAVGDDPAYVNAIAQVARSGAVLYQSYFSGESIGPQLMKSPKSLAAYRRHFGADGDAAP